MTQSNLGNALFGLGIREQSTERIEEAIATYRAALQVLTSNGPAWYRDQVEENLDRALRILRR